MGTQAVEALSSSNLSSVAPEIVRMQSNGRLTVRWVPRDLGPLTKLLPTIANAEEHATRFVRRGAMNTSASAEARSIARALSSMAIVAIDDHDVYSKQLLCSRDRLHSDNCSAGLLTEVQTTEELNTSRGPELHDAYFPWVR